MSSLSPLQKKYNLKDDVRESLYDDCNLWVKAVKAKGGAFHGGDRPDLADLAVYGCLGAIAGCESFADALTNTNIGPWYERMREAVGQRAGKDLVA